MSRQYGIGEAPEQQTRVSGCLCISPRERFLCVPGVFFFFTASELLMGAHHEGSLTVRAGREEPPSAL